MGFLGNCISRKIPPTRLLETSCLSFSMCISNKHAYYRPHVYQRPQSTCLLIIKHFKENQYSLTLHNNLYPFRLLNEVYLRLIMHNGCKQNRYGSEGGKLVKTRRNLITLTVAAAKQRFINREPIVFLLIIYLHQLGT